MISKKILAVVLLVVIVISLIGTALVSIDFVKEKTSDIAKVKLYVAEKAPQPTALVSLNVLTKTR